MSRANRISVDRKYDRDRPGRLFGGQDCQRGPGDNDVNLEGDEFGGQRGKAVGTSLRGSELEGDVLALHKAEFAQPLPEGSDKTGGLGA